MNLNKIKSDRKSCVLLFIFLSLPKALDEQLEVKESFLYCLFYKLFNPRDKSLTLRARKLCQIKCKNLDMFVVKEPFHWNLFGSL